MDDKLYAWQAEALAAWRDENRRGIVEAVTGTGKTRVGQEAIREALSEGRRVTVLVPGQELQRQWHANLSRYIPPRVRVGLLGDGHRDSMQNSNLLIAIVNSAREQLSAAPDGALIVADECHRYASPENHRALLEGYELRLGLTATLERPDRLEWKLLEYFGPICYQIGYARALADSVVAPFSVALLGARMSGPEYVEYDIVSQRVRDFFKELVKVHGYPTVPFHLFMRRVKEAADDPQWRPDKEPAVGFLKAVFERKDLLAKSPAKRSLARRLAPAIACADRSLVFTESKEVAEEIALGLRSVGLTAAALHSDMRPPTRKEVLRRFGAGHLDAVVAPRVLDEGVDVPAADLAIIVSASRTRRQMIQRMGRVLRRKTDDRLARIAILYLLGTTEDPTSGAHEAFLDEVLPVADDIEIFANGDLERALTFLSIIDPFEGPLPPRMEGDPERAVRIEVPAEDALDAGEFFGVEERASVG